MARFARRKIFSLIGDHRILPGLSPSVKNVNLDLEMCLNKETVGAESFPGSGLSTLLALIEADPLLGAHDFKIEVQFKVQNSKLKI